jgi:exodeoxyribonuclease VII small subunit
MSKDVDYQKLNQELEVLLNDLESGSGDVDKAIAKYQRGMEIVKQLEAYLKTAKNKVQKIKADLA